MAQGYDDAAQAARDAGFIGRADVRRQDVRQDLRNFFKVDSPNSTKAQRLLRETTRRIMDDRVQFDDGSLAGRRRNLTTWEDRWGNIMARNVETGTQSKLVDAEERGVRR
jgi:hypothetical protein